MTFSVEDDLDEQTRRFDVILQTMGSSCEDVQDHLIPCGPNGPATMLEFDRKTGKADPTELLRVLEQDIQELKPDVVILDPLAEIHTAEENDNGALRTIIAAFRELAIKYSIGVVICHHTAKGRSLMAGDADMARGASSIVNAARIAITVCVMSEEEAKDLGIPHKNKEHYDYFRVDGAKSNYARKTGTEWFFRQVGRTRNGEYVAAAIPWTPPVDDIDDDVMARVREMIAKGAFGKQPWSPAREGYPNGHTTG